MKRSRDAQSQHIEGSAVKDENKSIREPLSLNRSISPPPTRRRKSDQISFHESKSIIAQVEAGEKHVEDHLSFFSSKLSEALRSSIAGCPRIDRQSWIDLYTGNNNNSNGHHFVIHQHDHPVAGTHYDLRLQCNDTSSASWAIMYGLPGDPNSRRLNRNATETRIHCLWNHLIETASHQTGTLLIWDTGTYEILPYRQHEQSSDTTTDEDISDIENKPNPAHSWWSSLSEPEKLHRSFQDRRIRLRLHGARLPKNYTLSLWLRSSNDRTAQPTAPKTRRRKHRPTLSRRPSNPGHNTDSDRERDTGSDRAQDIDTDSEAITRPTQLPRRVSSLQRRESPPHQTQNSKFTDQSIHSTTTDDEELIRSKNAYIGATNSINSIHQRRWYLALDRTNSGFVKDRHGIWVPRGSTDVRPSSRQCDGTPQGFIPFHVLGRDHERSVVTGRLAKDILADEGVVGYVPRGKWRAVTE